MDKWIIQGHEIDAPAACLFDFDLTLADGSPWIVRCFRQVLLAHGYNDVADEAIRATIGLTVEDAMMRLTGLTDYDDAHALRMEFKSLCRPRMAEMTHIFEDARLFLHRLRGAGVHCAIVSTKEGAVIAQTLVLNGMDGMADLIVGLAEVSEPKPSPEGICSALRTLNIAPQRALYFGDSLVDGMAAQRAGVPFVGVSRGVHSPESLAKFPHVAVIDNYNNIVF